MSVEIDVLIPTYARPAALAVVLSCLAGQTLRSFRVIVSDQSDGGGDGGEGAFGTPEFIALQRFFRARKIGLVPLRHLPRRGMAEQRAFLLAQATARYSLFLDDDVLIEPDLLSRLLQTIKRVQSGFVGSALHSLSHVGEDRPGQERVNYWDNVVEPGTVEPDSVLGIHHQPHADADLFHLQSDPDLLMGHTRCHRVAWVGGCVLFDTEKLRSSGGFDFWPELPVEHAGEDVLAQLKVMQRFGGCAIVPSGAYHMELPTTLPGREMDAPKALWR